MKLRSMTDDVRKKPLNFGHDPKEILSVLIAQLIVSRAKLVDHAATR